jgi:hypothetical protein
MRCSKLVRLPIGAWFSLFTVAVERAGGKGVGAVDERVEDVPPMRAVVD